MNTRSRNGRSGGGETKNPLKEKITRSRKRVKQRPDIGKVAALVAPEKNEGSEENGESGEITDEQLLNEMKCNDDNCPYKRKYEIAMSSK